MAYKNRSMGLRFIHGGAGGGGSEVILKRRSWVEKGTGLEEIVGYRMEKRRG